MTAAVQLVHHGLSAAPPLSNGTPDRINYSESAAQEKQSSTPMHVSFVTTDLTLPNKEGMSSEILAAGAGIKS